jgi:nucleotide-binding universal stress UspA family protein
VKLLVAVDLSESTGKIIEKSRHLAKALSAKVWVLHIAEPEPDFVGLDVGPQYERDALSEKFHRQHSEIQAIAEGLRKEGLDTTALLVQGATIESILKEVSKLDPDIVVVGSHGGGAMRQLLVGSVSEGVLRKADCPILVIPTR